jgi:hypothetical protein
MMHMTGFHAAAAPCEGHLVGLKLPILANTGRHQLSSGNINPHIKIGVLFNIFLDRKMPPMYRDLVNV